MVIIIIMPFVNYASCLFCAYNVCFARIIKGTLNRIITVLYTCVWQNCCFIRAKAKDYLRSVFILPIWWHGLHINYTVQLRLSHTNTSVIVPKNQKSASVTAFSFKSGNHRYHCLWRQFTFKWCQDFITYYLCSGKGALY